MRGIARTRRILRPCAVSVFFEVKSLIIKKTDNNREKQQFICNNSYSHFGGEMNRSYRKIKVSGNVLQWYNFSNGGAGYAFDRGIG